MTQGVRAWPGLPAARRRRYHMVLEGMVFDAGQSALLDDLDDGALPGVRESIERVELDERWHVGFGLRCLIEAHPSPDLLDDLWRAPRRQPRRGATRSLPPRASAPRTGCPAAVGRRAHRRARGGIAGTATAAGRGRYSVIR